MRVLDKGINKWFALSIRQKMKNCLSAIKNIYGGKI